MDEGKSSKGRLKMAKYKIVKSIEDDGIWFRAYDEQGKRIGGTISETAEECEERLRFVVLGIGGQETVKEVEI